MSRSNRRRWVCFVMFCCLLLTEECIFGTLCIQGHQMVCTRMDLGSPHQHTLLLTACWVSDWYLKKINYDQMSGLSKTAFGRALQQAVCNYLILSDFFSNMQTMCIFVISMIQRECEAYFHINSAMAVRFFLVCMVSLKLVTCLKVNEAMEYLLTTWCWKKAQVLTQ